MSNAPLSTEEYMAQMRSYNEKTITLESGFTYRIKKLSTTESLILMDKYTALNKDARSAYMKMRDVNRDAKKKNTNMGDVLNKHLTPTQRMDMHIESLISCIIEPKSPELWVPELPGPELIALIAECDLFAGESSVFKKKESTSDLNPSKDSE